MDINRSRVWPTEMSIPKCKKKKWIYPCHVDFGKFLEGNLFFNNIWRELGLILNGTIAIASIHKWLVRMQWNGGNLMLSYVTLSKKATSAFVSKHLFAFIYLHIRWSDHLPVGAVVVVANVPRCISTYHRFQIVPLACVADRLPTYLPGPFLHLAPTHISPTPYPNLPLHSPTHTLSHRGPWQRDHPHWVFYFLSQLTTSIAAAGDGHSDGAATQKSILPALKGRGRCRKRRRRWRWRTAADTKMPTLAGVGRSTRRSCSQRGSSSLAHPPPASSPASITQHKYKLSTNSVNPYPTPCSLSVRRRTTGLHNRAVGRRRGSQGLEHHHHHRRHHHCSGGGGGGDNTSPTRVALCGAQRAEFSIVGHRLFSWWRSCLVESASRWWGASTAGCAIRILAMQMPSSHCTNTLWSNIKYLPKLSPIIHDLNVSSSRYNLSRLKYVLHITS